MCVANYFYLDTILAPLNVLSPDEEMRVNLVDPDDERAVRSVINEILLPEFEKLTDDSKQRIKDALRFFLTTQEAPFRAIIRSQQESPLGCPKDPISLFNWIWKEFFPNESFVLTRTDKWTVDNKASAVRLERK